MKTAAQKRQKATKLRWIYCPKDFDVEDYGIDRKYELQVRYLLNCIWFYKVTGKRDDSKYIELSTDFLGPLYGRNNLVEPIRTMCVEAGLVESDNHYIPGEKSIGYRLGRMTRDLDFVRYDLQSFKAVDRFKKFKKEITTYELDELGIYFKGWIDRVKFSKVAVRKTIARMPTKKANVAQAQIGYLEQGVVGLKYCAYGRFHSPFTRLCSELRPLLTIDGQSLHEVDVVNSQPVVLAGLIHSQEGTSPGLQRFYDDVKDGTIYEKFQQEYGISDRRRAKDLFFTAIYGRASRIKPFEKLYPEAAAVVLRWKRLHGYKWVPCEMQRRESQIIIRGAADRLRRDHPDVPVITIHDSISTTDEHLALVKSVIEEAFAAAGFPFVPRLRVKGI